MADQLPVGAKWESNPYPAGGTLPMDRLMQTLRQQHDKQQAGDTQFHWSYLTQVYPKQAYSLGSSGRFLHPTYGIIRARFCKFSAPNGGLWPGDPVGFVQGDFAWEVTNVFANSATGLCAGVQGSYTALADGQFGWVIEDGINIQALYISGSAPGFGSALDWTGDGVATVAAAGRLGMVVNPATLSGGKLAPGSVRIKVR